MKYGHMCFRAVDEAYKFIENERERAKVDIYVTDQVTDKHISRDAKWQ